MFPSPFATPLSLYVTSMCRLVLLLSSIDSFDRFPVLRVCVFNPSRFVPQLINLVFVPNSHELFISHPFHPTHDPLHHLIVNITSFIIIVVVVVVIALIYVI